MPITRTCNALLVSICFALHVPGALAATTVLKYSDHEPFGGMRTRFIEEVFFKAIEKESKGRLKIEATWDGKLATGYDALKVVGDGSKVDMATVVPEYSAPQLPLHQLFKSYPVGPTGTRQVAFFRQVYEKVPAFPAELASNNVTNVLVATGYPVAFFSNKTLGSLDDIKGEKWRYASFWHKDFLSNAGAAPVSMPWGEGIYTAIKQGDLTGLMVNVDSGYMLKVHEVAPNVLVSKDLWLGHAYLVVMNKATWEGLAKEDRNAIQRAARTAYKTLGSVMDQSFVAQVDDLKRSGVNIRGLSQTEVKAWEVKSNYRAVQAAWVAQQDANGLKHVAPALKAIDAIMNRVMK